MEIFVELVRDIFGIVDWSLAAITVAVIIVVVWLSGRD